MSQAGMGWCGRSCRNWKLDKLNDWMLWLVWSFDVHKLRQVRYLMRLLIIRSLPIFMDVMRPFCRVCSGDLYKLPLRRLQMWRSLATLSWSRAPKRIRPLEYNGGNHQPKSPNFVDDWRIFTIEMSRYNTIVFRKLLCNCRVIAKIISWFIWRHYGSECYGRMPL